MENSEKEKAYNTDELTNLIKEVVGEAIGDVHYVHAKVAGWNNTIIESCLKKLKEKNKNYKYVVTCIVMQKKGAGFYSGSSVFWDQENDASASYIYEAKTLFAVVNVFALSL